MADIVHEVTIHSPAERIFDAITAWWTADTEAEPRVGSTALFGFSRRALVFRMLIEALDRARRVAWRCSGDHPEWKDTRVTFDLRPSEEPGATTGRFVHGGWRSARRLARSVQLHVGAHPGASQAIRRDRPARPVLHRPVSGPRLHLTRVLDAPRDRVSRTWTDPQELERWWGPRGYVTRSAEVELRVGGHYRLGMAKLPDGATFYLAGTFTIVEPPARLVYTWRWEAEPEQGETLVTVTFREVGRDSTEVSITQEGFPAEKLADDHTRGWNGCLDRLVQRDEDSDGEDSDRFHRRKRSHPTRRQEVSDARQGRR